MEHLKHCIDSAPVIPRRHHPIYLTHLWASVGPSANVCELPMHHCEYHSWTTIVPQASGSNPGYQPATWDQSLNGLLKEKVGGGAALGRGSG